jgi:hypothetical protein
MEDQVVYCVCVKELGLSGTVAGFFERELFPPSLHLSISLSLWIYFFSSFTSGWRLCWVEDGDEGG